MKKKKYISKTEYSKRWLAVILISAITLTLLCVWLDRQELGEHIWDGSVALTCGYFVKAFFGKKNEEKTRLREKEIDGGLTFFDCESEVDK